MATEVKQRNNRVIVLVGVVIALVAFGLSLYISHNGSNNSASTGSTIPVAVAATDLVQGSQISPASISIVQYQPNQVPAGSSPNGASLMNQFLAVGVSKNTPLTSNLMVPSASAAQGAALTVQPLAISKGYVAMAIPANGGGGAANPPSPDEVSVGYWIQPGDYIDIIEDTGSSIRYAFQDVQVLKVGDQGTAAGGTPTVYIVEVPRAQAEELAYLIANKTDLTGGASGPHIVAYVLRGVPENNSGYLPDASPNLPPVQDAPVTPQTFNSLFPSK